MTIKQLKKILEKAPNENRNVYIPSYDGSDRSLDVGYNYDDLCDLDLYVIYNWENTDER